MHSDKLLPTKLVGELYRFSGAKRTTLAGFLSTSPSFSHEFRTFIWESVGNPPLLQTTPDFLLANCGRRQGASSPNREIVNTAKISNVDEEGGG
ncbi:hypothetical protein CDAR_462891 [Caerostris darwini]|uniref:Uncharacterized protein n=1 Tax=Caerostris darwini TaxID=1538125 RepID=A0AAV4QDI0_9ARAC|nr:hypothetical protein CDAR_462891 [Caerostris darwini]